MKFTEFQLKEISKYWFDLSKLTFVSLILKFFEPGSPSFSWFTVLTIFFGLTATALFAIVGLRISREVKNAK